MIVSLPEVLKSFGQIFFMKNIIIFTFLAFTSLVSAQKLSGTIMDGEFNEPLAFSNVVVKGTIIGTTSDFEGKYTLDVPVGVYTIQFFYLGYETKEISNVEMVLGKLTEVDVVMNPSSNQLDEVVLVTSARQNSETAILNVQRKSVNLLDGLSAQSIKKVGDSDLAGAIKRVPGVSVQGGKYVYVRGLGDRYSKTVLNGLEVPGLDPDRNTLQLDIFPTNLIENILVSKSASADLPSDFSGGVVDIVTKDFSLVPEYSINVSANYNPSMHFKKDYIRDFRSKTDFLGFDSNYRDLPLDPKDNIPNAITTSSEANLLPGITKSFDPKMGVMNAQNEMNFSLGATASNQYSLKNDKSIGFIASLGYKYETTYYDDFFNGTAINQFQELEPYFSQQGRAGIENILLSGLAGVSFKTKRSKYKLNLLYLQNGESNAIKADYEDFIENPYIGTGELLTYTERNITSIPLTGKHSNLNGDAILEWKLAYNKATVADKDFRRTVFETDSERSYFALSSSTTNFPTRFWRNLEEDVLNGKIDYSKEIKLGNTEHKWKFGVGYVGKTRDFSTFNYTIGFKGDSNVLSGNANEILLNKNIWSPANNFGSYAIGNFQATNQYNSESTNQSAYISDEIRFSSKFKAVLGLRFENYVLKYSGQNLEGAVYDKATFIDKKDFFPSANLILSPTEDQNVRFSYAKTTARPSFKEASAITLYDPITERFFIGNPDLKPSYIDNLDLRFEKYGAGGDFFAVSAFAKLFKDPIEINAVNLNSPNQLTGKNNKNAQLLGMEIEYRKDFIKTEFFTLNFNTNISIIEAKQKMSDAEYQGRLIIAEGRPLNDSRKLQGQSPYMINSGLNFKINKSNLEGGLFYNVQGKTLEVVGIGIVPDVYSEPFHSLNYSMQKSFGKDQRQSIKLTVDNLLGDIRESFYSFYDQPELHFSRFKPGTSFTLAYNLKF
ncbi:MAG: outer membrane receptor protein involved in Fe transport [Flavobacteriaceae bacterium]